MSFLFQQSTAQSEQTDGDADQGQLFVFGYHCKLFRDDERALSIDAGEHLIPWMGDESNKIDRFDGRGHLFDLRPYDADLNKSTMSQLSSDELRIERLCEEERYLELHTDLAERAIQEEEELKRLNQELAADTNSYQAVGFSYNQPAASDGNDGVAAGEVESAEEEDEDTPFIPPVELCLPKSMSHPEGNKLNSIIEKTAKFVSEHGGQMEIMIKTKQAGNPQFEFLHFEHNLNPYYKHQVYMIKSGRYNPDIHNKNSTVPKHEKDEESDSDDDGYLHPSLFAPKTTEAQTTTSTKVSLPAISQDQLANTAYGRLMQKLSNKLPRSNTSSPLQTAAHSPSYYNFNTNSTDSTDAAYQQGYYYDGQNSTAYNSEYYTDPSYYATAEPTDTTGQSNQSESEHRPPSPPADIKPLVERLLMYVKKDGEAFEQQVIQRNDSRFSFLQPNSEYYKYYTWRKKRLVQESVSTTSPKKQAVSFSIKYKETEQPSIDSNKAALPVDPESDEEEAKNNQENQSINQLAGALGPVYSPNPAGSPVISSDQPSRSPNSHSLPHHVPTEAEMENASQQQQRKLAEQKLRDKLAAAMREKMTQVTSNTREKSLQAERKKKAAMFVNMLKSKKTTAASQHSAPIGPELPLEMLHPSEPYAHDYQHQSLSVTDQSLSSKHHSHRERRGERGSSSSKHRDERHRRRKSPSPLSHHRKEKHRRESSAEKLTASRSHRSRPVENSNEQRINDVSKRRDVSTELDEDYVSQVRKKLKASRREVYKEDLFGE